MLIPKVEQRIGQYLNFLEKHAYRKIADLDFEVFEAGETFRTPPKNADWKKINIPAAWGKEWTCFWFRTVYRAPLNDTPLFISVTPNADSLAFIDGKPAGAFNRLHNKLRIDADGKEHTVHIEAYSGHPCGGCDPLGSVSFFVNTGGKKLPAFPNTFEGGSLLERRPAVHSLYYDVFTLYETAKIADPNSLRKAKILRELSESLSIISLNVDNNELDEQAAAAAQRLAPLLALKNSPSTPAMHLIGHAHLDHAWLWPIAETERKTARTFSNMLRFIKEYPEFIFFQSQPCHLEIIKNEYPHVFEGIKEAYKNGNWEPNGGMFVEADCNVTSGESLIRQFLVGKKVNKELLGHEADTLWLPDVFGYAAALPQILEGCRIKYFVTSKMSWNDTTRFPYETFIWRGIDGTGIKTHFLSGCNGKAAPEEIAATWNTVQHKELQSACVKAIGEGDGGGGTMRADLEVARRIGDLEGTPRTAWKTVSAALDDIFSSGGFPEWRGELYLELHRGTYTTQARTKRNNRCLEFALRNTEFLCALAALEGRGEYPHEELLDCWKGTLINQFHDIIPGSSIGRVYAEAEADSQRMLTQLANLCEDAKSCLAGIKENSGKGTELFLFNDLSWIRCGPVSILATCLGYPATPEKVSPMILMQAPDEEVTYPVQQYVDFDNHTRIVFSPQIPSLGWVKYNVVIGRIDSISCFNWQNDTLETPFYKMAFDPAGRITSLFDKRSNCEMVAPGGAFNALISAEDLPVYWDAWDIDADWVNHIVQETRLVSTELVSIGSELFCLRRVYDIGKASCLIQDMMCYGSDPRIDFVTKVDWHEKHRLLKVEFDTAIDTSQVRCEVQYGHLWRNTHRNLMQDRAKFEICAHKWISLEEEGAGISLLNDCKYGHDVEGGRMRLSLLRSPVAPDPDADQGEHRFTYSLLPFAGSFGSSGVINSAYELNSPVGVLAGHTDSSLRRQSLCTLDGTAVIIESVKAPSGCQPNELVLRLYESLGGRCRTALHFSRDLVAAAETDMLEENPRPLTAQGGDICLEFRPFEIKTLRVSFGSL